MKIVFISCYFNHHQKPLCDAFHKLTNGGFTFVATTQITEWRRKMGYKELSAEYVLDCSDGRNINQAIELINKADAVITDAEDLTLTKDRYSKNDLIFRYSERLFKSKLRYLKAPVYFWKSFRTRKMLLLCGSAYSKRDYNMMGMYKNKCYKWGYFPQVIQYDDVDKLISDTPKKILWVGRFIDWKHPEACVCAAQKLRQKGYGITIDMVGTGNMEEQIRKLAIKEGVDDIVHVLGAKQIPEVRQMMEEADVFLSTSDIGEGWGAVVNEAMNSACAVVASDAVGSVPYLIKHKVNGLIYKDQDWHDLSDKIAWLLDNPKDYKRIAEEAYHTIAELWNGEQAAKNFITLVEDIKAGRDSSITEGPGSKA